MRERVQLSLIFKDSDFFHNFIKPYHDNKELNALVLKLLRGYFTSDAVQTAVETFDNQEEIIVSDDSNSFTETINDARRTLAYMNMLAEGAKNELNNGIVRINEIAQMTGGTPAEENEFGMGMPQFGSIQEVQAVTDVSESVAPAPALPDSFSDKRFSLLEAQVNSLTQLVTSLTTTVNALASGGGVIQPIMPQAVAQQMVSPQVTVSQVETPQPIQQPPVTEIYSEPEVATANVVVNDITDEDITDEAVSDEHVAPPPVDMSVDDSEEQIDGTASLLDFMNSGIGFSVEL